MARLDRAIHGKVILEPTASGRVAMDYLKFGGLCLLAGIVFLVCGIIFPGSYLGYTLGLTLGLAITGAGFARVNPAHFKVGYAIWIGVTIISCFGTKWVAKMYVRTELENIDYIVAWLVGCALSNPACYWLGKHLHFRITCRRALSSLAETSTSGAAPHI